jgi:hypothetical protein
MKKNTFFYLPPPADVTPGRRRRPGPPRKKIKIFDLSAYNLF